MTPSAGIGRLRTLFELKRGRAFPLPPQLLRLYGNFHMPAPRSAPLVFSNFVSSMDGVVSLHVEGHAGGGDISGFSIQDRMVMGLLRAVADVVIVGTGTLEADPQHVRLPKAICPEPGERLSWAAKSAGDEGAGAQRDRQRERQCRPSPAGIRLRPECPS